MQRVTVKFGSDSDTKQRYAGTCAGIYLPLTAVLGGLLFVRVEGYLEADRDVIRLDPDVATMQAQQGYVCCMPQATLPAQGNTYVAPLHCCVRVLPSQVYPRA